MKLVKMLMVPLFLGLFVSQASAYYFGGLDDYVAGVPSQNEKAPFKATWREGMVIGSFQALDPENRSMMILASVPGFLGPEQVSVPINVSSDAAVNICHRDTGECEIIGYNGWDSLASVNQDILQNASVIVMGYPENPTRIINIEVGPG